MADPCKSIEEPRWNWKLGLTTSEYQEFRDTYSRITKIILDSNISRSNPKLKERYKQLLAYAELIGNIVSGPLTVSLYKQLCKEHGIQPDLELANAAGYCIELVQSTIIILDDMLDRSEDRRGQTCWYKRFGEGCTAFDAFFIHNGIFDVLEKYFKDKECYENILAVFREQIQFVVYGIMLDSLPEMTDPLKLYTGTDPEHRYLYTTSELVYLFPYEVAVAMTGRHLEQHHHDTIRKIGTKLGEFCRNMNDYKDIIIHPETAKSSSDIKSGKYSWCFMVAMQSANPEQMQLLIENYGKDDPQKVAVVEDLYRELNIPSKFKKFEVEALDELTKLITLIPDSLGHIFTLAAKQLQKRIMF